MHRSGERVRLDMSPQSIRVMGDTDVRCERRKSLRVVAITIFGAPPSKLKIDYNFRAIGPNSRRRGQ